MFFGSLRKFASGTIKMITILIEVLNGRNLQSI